MSNSATSASQEGVDRRIARIARAQHGVFSWHQAASAGATPAMANRRVKTGRWEHVKRGVYRLAGAPPSWQQDLHAACLACGENAAVSHRAAAGVFQLAGYGPGPVELLVPRGKRVRRVGMKVYTTTFLPRVDVVRVDGLRVTSPARTLLGLAAVDPPDIVEIALDDALARGLVTVDRLRRRFDVLAKKGRDGIEPMRTMLAERDPGNPPAKSPLETRFRRFLKAIGAPDPVRQHPVTCNGKRYYLDFAYPDRLVGFELDGYAAHAGRQAFDSDRARLSDLVAQGWRVFPVTSRHLDSSVELAARLSPVIPAVSTSPRSRRRTSVG